MNKTCQNCQQSNPPEAAFCLNCSSPLVARGQYGGSQPANQQWNQPNFGGQRAAQNFAHPAASGGASQRAMTAAGLALGGLICCGPFTSIPAAIVGWMEIDAIKKGQSPPAGMKFAQIGLWGGIAVTLLQGVAFLFWIIMSMAAASSPYGY